MRFRNIKIKVLTILGFLALGFSWAIINTNITYADEPTNSLFVSPMTQKIVLIPGETYNGSISISNAANSTEDIKYVAEIGSYSRKKSGDSNDDYGVVSVEDISSYNIMMDWITLDKSTGTVVPNGKETINFSIKVPKNAPAGAQYASILVYEADEQEKNNGSGNSASVTAKYQLASAIIANVAGETVEKGSISENNMPSVLTNNKLEATSMVRNDGNIYTDATYTLQVWPLTSDEELCTNEEKAETSMILPNTERYHVQTCDLPAVGIFRAKQVVKIFGEESVLEKTIFVCPVWLMILAIVIVVAIVIAIVVMVRKRKKSASQD